MQHVVTPRYLRIGLAQFISHIVQDEKDSILNLIEFRGKTRESMTVGVKDQLKVKLPKQELTHSDTTVCLFRPLNSQII